MISNEPTKIAWSAIDAVLFDVDGTLYDQSALRLRMFGELCRWYSLRFWKLRDLKLLYDFRRLRERHCGAVSNSLMEDQYKWVAETSHASTDYVREVVTEWMDIRPLKHLAACRYAEVTKFVDLLSSHGKAVAFVSDYPVKAKLRALGIPYKVAIAATDNGIGAFKPNPKIMLKAASVLGITPDRCLVIGDRDDRDGSAAEKAGMMYLSIAKRTPWYPALIESLEGEAECETAL